MDMFILISDLIIDWVIFPLFLVGLAYAVALYLVKIFR